MTTRDKLRLINLCVGILNLHYWNTGSGLSLLVIGCLNIGVFVFGKE
jgi:hypothetical protein